MDTPFPLYRAQTIDEIIGRMETDFRSHIETLCAITLHDIHDIADTERGVPILQYAIQCAILTIEIKVLLRRHWKMIGQASGSFNDCEYRISRTNLLAELEQVRLNIVHSLKKFRVAILLIFPVCEYPACLIHLKDTMASMDCAITDLFYLEKTTFIRKIIKLFVHTVTEPSELRN